MDGIKLIFWAVVYELWNAVFHRNKRYRIDCGYCDHSAEARSENMAILKNSLHTWFGGDHLSKEEQESADWEQDPDLKLIQE